MNVEIQLVVGFVIDLILIKRYIADSKVKEVTPIGGLLVPSSDPDRNRCDQDVTETH